MFKTIQLHVLPRETMSWEEFLKKTPERSIALDGVVLAPPRFDEKTLHLNLDHHNGVEREATMSTVEQTLFAIKGGLMDRFTSRNLYTPHVYVNDPDQDTSLSVCLLERHKLFEGTHGHPVAHRLIALTNRLDITGGAFPMNLDEALVRKHAWVFDPYTRLRKSGMLADANDVVMTNCIEAILGRFDALLMNRGGEQELDTRHEILFDHPRFKIIREIGGVDARYYLFGRGLDAFISLVATRADGRHVYTVGRRSRFVNFPVPLLYNDFNSAEGLTGEKIWDGSTIVGGCRNRGSRLPWEELKSLTLARLKAEGID